MAGSIQLRAAYSKCRGKTLQPRPGNISVGNITIGGTGLVNSAGIEEYANATRLQKRRVLLLCRSFFARQAMGVLP
jgi:hypothetical protein